MPASKAETLMLQSDGDIVRVRQATRAKAVEVGLSLVDQTKVVTAASELARNTIRYGGGGTVVLEQLDTGRAGLKLTFKDEGPGIPNIEEALKDGYTTGGGLGLGLSGAKRLSSEFNIESRLGQGTTVTIVRWKG